MLIRILFPSTTEVTIPVSLLPDPKYSPVTVTPRATVSKRFVPFWNSSTLPPGLKFANWLALVSVNFMSESDTNLNAVPSYVICASSASPKFALRVAGIFNPPADALVICILP